MKNFLFLLLISNLLNAQEVKSKSYKLMLNALLNHSVPELSITDVVEGDAVFLDARELNEFQVSKIAASLWVGYDDFSMERIKGIAKDQEIVVYCSVGYRSEKIAEKLMEAGYSKVSNLYGGVFEWMNQDQEVVDSAGVKTEKVHAFNLVWGVWLNKGKKVYK